jgi:hypothetical protein
MCHLNHVGLKKVSGFAVKVIATQRTEVSEKEDGFVGSGKLEYE